MVIGRVDDVRIGQAGGDVAVLAAIKYVRNQYDPLVVWVNEEVIRTTFGETGERYFGERGPLGPC